MSDLVLGEAYSALLHHDKAPAPAALAALKALLEERRIEASPAASRAFAVSGLASAQPGLFDRLVHEGYLEAGASLVTFDKAAAKLAGARLLGG
ncbi:MAG: hypothetical protein ACT4PV_10340 [Planctomycetaceae bacterium]